MLLVKPGADAPQGLHFNPQFIARNGVDAVNAQVWTKRRGHPMEALDRYSRYQFGERGRMDRSASTFGKAGTDLDTASVMYSYDSTGHLLLELHNDLHGFFALRTAYGPDGRPVRKTHVRIENLSGDRGRFEAGASTVISDESYSYTELNDTVWRKTFMNDRGRPYMEEVFTKDRLGYLRSIEAHNLITQRRGRTVFSYDEQGRLAERTEQADLARPAISTWKWTYDAAGNPLTRDLFRNGELIRHSEFLYAKGTLFLKAVITKNNGTGLIDILRFEVDR